MSSLVNHRLPHPHIHRHPNLAAQLHVGDAVWVVGATGFPVQGVVVELLHGRFGRLRVRCLRSEGDRSELVVGARDVIATHSLAA